MAPLDTDRLLEMLRDPNVESRDVAAAAGVTREDAARAARLVVAIPEPPRPPPPPAAAAPETPLACYATVIDGQGERAIWIPRAVPGKGVEIAQAVTSDERGLLELQLGLIGRKEWRKLIDGLLERGR